MAALRSLVVKTAVCWGVLLVLFCGLLIAAYAIPSSCVERNAEVSALTNVSDEAASGEGSDPSRWASTTTVSIMLSMAVHDRGGLLESAMSGAYFESDQGIADIGIGERANRTYEWYWHGWLVVLKPLLVFFDYATIKKLFMAVCAGLLVALCALASRKLPRGRGYCLALVASFALTSTFHAMEVLPFFFSICIALLGSLVVLRLETGDSGVSSGRILLLFFVLGAFTSYFDFLVTPALTMLVPLAWFVLARVELGEGRLRSLLATSVALAAFWCLGYGLLWLSKWMIASLVLGTNVFDLGINQFLFRSGAEGYADNRTAVIASEWQGVKVTPCEAIRLNMETAFPGVSGSSFVIASAAVMAGCVVLSANRKGTALSLCLGAVWLAPYVWYAILANHSIIHYYFTCRLQAASLFALFALVVYAACGARERMRAWKR